MSSLKKALLTQLDEMLRKGALDSATARTLVTKVELTDDRLIKMALETIAKVREAQKPKKEDEEIAKDGMIARAAAAISKPLDTHSIGGIGVASAPKPAAISGPTSAPTTATNAGAGG